MRRGYNRSKYCLILDGRAQFFEAVGLGCLPVVIAYRPDTADESWWQDRGEQSGPSPTSDGGFLAPFEDSYPFPESVAYKDFVVRVPFEQFVREGVIPALERVTEAERLRRTQALLRHRSLLTYDFAARAPDAFELLLRKLTDLLPRIDSGASGLIPCPP
eukprot:gene18266-28155_t